MADAGGAFYNGYKESPLYEEVYRFMCDLQTVYFTGLKADKAIKEAMKNNEEKVMERLNILVVYLNEVGSN